MSASTYVFFMSLAVQMELQNSARDHLVHFFSPALLTSFAAAACRFINDVSSSSSYCRVCQTVSFLRFGALGAYCSSRHMFCCHLRGSTSSLHTLILACCYFWCCNARL
ncbi:hypothetical protein SERLADRAFT_476115 [Serpula lacrymans var. lacrymans S7.9]|uniref:Uncharacterized protein n=1 Tax=Serpula lacrymans var. lacrymans (strain S7.9) TaxID=578457 RepID=F8P6Z4_SERL9|nr:uncharacterized protein SERLADRAFT_476115 [Serpula lacrymans var. lacrymans S7.9]EGO21210.1 hypothetical protein SERLADRAFT_476115 [Serpula lacrymans var. lacrymans S7.9]